MNNNNDFFGDKPQYGQNLLNRINLLRAEEQKAKLEALKAMAKVQAWIAANDFSIMPQEENNNKKYTL